MARRKQRILRAIQSAGIAAQLEMTPQIIKKVDAELQDVIREEIG